MTYTQAQYPGEQYPERGQLPEDLNALERDMRALTVSLTGLLADLDAAMQPEKPCRSRMQALYDNLDVVAGDAEDLHEELLRIQDRATRGVMVEGRVV